MKYENRVVAFIDILGFKERIMETIKDEDKEEKRVDDIINAYKKIIDIWDLDKNEKFVSESKKVTIFSDSIVVSFLINETSEVFHTLLELKWLVMSLLKVKILCRGAVTYGKFIHDDNFLFGPALIEAYILESKAALYPRIILDRPIIDIGSEFRSTQHNEDMEREFVESLLELDSDGMFYIDYFTKAQEELDEPEHEYPNYIENLKDIIKKGLMGTSHQTKADVRVKYAWMRERFNKMVDILKDIDFIKKLEESGEVELANYYKSLKKISPNKFKNLLGQN